MTLHRLEVYLPQPRDLSGHCHLIGPTGAVKFTAPILGKADNQAAIDAGNPERDPLKPYGDTPAGEYLPARFTDVTQPDKWPRLGKRRIVLIGATGAAAMATAAAIPQHVEVAGAGCGGRTGLALHAGRDEDQRTQRGQLVATQGCLRMLPWDLAKLDRETNGEPILVRVTDLA